MSNLVIKIGEAKKAVSETLDRPITWRDSAKYVGAWLAVYTVVGIIVAIWYKVQDRKLKKEAEMTRNGRRYVSPTVPEDDLDFLK